MADDDYRRERLSDGWLDLRRDAEGVWRLRWTPDKSHPGYPGTTFSPGDAYLPSDHPGFDDPDALIAWGRKQFELKGERA